MGNSYRTLTVLLATDMDEDDIDHVVNALAMVKGVRDVVSGPPINLETFVARRIAHDQIQDRLRRALQMDLNNAEFYYDLVEKRGGES